MSEPSESDWTLLKKLARYLKAHPRQVCMFQYQDVPTELSIIVDTDYGGCKRTRKSTNGGLAMLGKHVIKTWSSTQTVVALSSGEAEYYGVTRGACEGIGILGLIGDLTGHTMKINLSTDLSAAKGIATRRGVGKVKHLETRTLWVHDQVDRGRLQIRKIDGRTNPADLLTKHLSGSRSSALLNDLPLCFEGGRHRLAVKLQGGGSECV